MKSVVKFVGIALFIVGFFAIGEDIVDIFEGAMMIVFGLALAIV